MGGTQALGPAGIVVGTATDPGRDPDKQVNEDAVAAFGTALGHVCVVCDGMGGHAGGKDASNAAIDTFRAELAVAASDAKPAEVLRRAVETANRKVFELASSSAGNQRPGSTIVAVLLHPTGAFVAHVGDSRLFRVRAGAADQLTKDHSVVQMMVDAGVLRQEEAASHPNANQIARALGAEETVQVEVTAAPHPYAAGDVFVLCSDGLSDLVEARELGPYVAGDDLDAGARALVDLANQRGGHDNISVVVARVDSPSIDLPSARPKTEPMAVAPTTVDPAVAPAPVALPPPAIPSAPGAPKRAVAPMVWLGLGLGIAAVVLAVVGLFVIRGQRHHRAPDFEFLDASITPAPTTTKSENDEVDLVPDEPPGDDNLDPLALPGDAAASDASRADAGHDSKQPNSP